MKSIQFDYEKVLTDKLDRIGANEFTETNILEMTLWKLSRYPHVNTDVLNKLNRLAYVSDIEEEKDRHLIIDALQALLGCKGVRLPMASTYLRFRNPKVFQIIDQRVWFQLYNEELTNSNDHTMLIEKYLKYLKDLRIKCQYDNIPFEMADRYYYIIDKDKKHRIRY